MESFINKYLSYFWESITLEFVFKFVLIYFFIIWIALLVWVIKDISIRTNNAFFQIFCVLIILILSPLGIFIYLLVRPRKTLYERYYDEIEDNLDIISEIVEERKAKLSNQSENLKIKAKKGKLLAKAEPKKTLKKERKTQIEIKKF